MRAPARGKHLDEPLDPAIARFLSSASDDRRLALLDITGSMAHARMLGRTGVLKPREVRSILDGLAAIAREAERGVFAIAEENEDVHMHVESLLTTRIGPVGGKLHTARSRNDQIALDLRLYVREAGLRAIDGTLGIVEGLLRLAAGNRSLIIPGTTHLQHAQPVLLGHLLLAWVAALERDVERLAQTLRRLNSSPLGAAALAGTSFPVDRELVARLLGFDRPVANAADAVSSRDFLLEYAAALSILGVHCSGIAEAFVVWATPEFGYVRLAGKVATGSSIMPQKRNPDVFELARARGGAMTGHLAGLLAQAKGLPLAYNRDLQDMKQGLFAAQDGMEALLPALAAALGGVRFDPARIAGHLAGSNLGATEWADYLARKGMPFREAHRTVSAIVARAHGSGRTIASMGLKELRGFSPLFERDALRLLKPAAIVAAKRSSGGTHPEEVSRALRTAVARLARQRRQVEIARKRLPDMATVRAGRLLAPAGLLAED